MFEILKIDKSTVPAVVQDNVRNVTKAMDDTHVRSTPCMAHTIHLVGMSGALCQRSISDVTATGRKFVGHSKRSPLPYLPLQTLQALFGTTPKRLQQDVTARGNRTFSA